MRSVLNVFREVCVKTNVKTTHHSLGISRVKKIGETQTHAYVATQTILQSFGALQLPDTYQHHFIKLHMHVHTLLFVNTNSNIFILYKNMFVCFLQLCKISK